MTFTISKEYLASSNNIKTLKLFLKRDIYLSYVASKEYQNVVNFANEGEMYLYGRVNMFYVPVVLRNPDYIKPITNSTNDSIRALNFVADAFDHMARGFKVRAQKGLISTSDPFLTNLKAYKGFLDPHTEYKKYFKVLSESMASAVSNPSHEVLKFDDMADIIIDYMHGIGKRFPFTQTAYIKSKICPMNVSGLVVEIADLNCSDDVAKFQQFMESPNWEIYVNSANQNGFIVDANVPWRLVADIRSKAMQYMMGANYMGNSHSFLGQRLRKVHVLYYDQFKAQLLRLYTKIRRPFISKPVACSKEPASVASRSPHLQGENVSGRRVVHPRTYTSVSDLEKEYGDLYFFKLYVRIRFSEEESKFTLVERERLEKRLINYYRAYGVYDALYRFERILNKPYDYTGSATHLNKRKERLMEQELKEAGLETAPASLSLLGPTGGGY